MNCLYLTFQGMGEDAKLRTQYESRKAVAGNLWDEQWNLMFTNNLTDHMSFETSYQELISHISKSMGIRLTKDHYDRNSNRYINNLGNNTSISLHHNNIEMHEYEHKSKYKIESLSKSELRSISNFQHIIHHSHIPKRSSNTLNISTWNIRHFGKKRRKKLAIYLIAEIIKKFDLIVISELRKDLRDLEHVRKILGPSWKYLHSDYGSGVGGNDERTCLLYDENAVIFNGLAAEVDSPRKKNVDGEYVSQIDWYRKPYVASFKAKSFKFSILVAQIAWQNQSSSRMKALTILSDWIDKRHKDRSSANEDIFLIGNYNIPNTDSDLFKAITSKGIKIPTAHLCNVFGSNLSNGKRYDQILHYPSNIESFTDIAGVLDFDRGGECLRECFPSNSMTKIEFTYQLSDHLPIWLQVNLSIK
jgi:hypothetical protein